MPFSGRRGQVPWLHKFFAHDNGIAIVAARTSADWCHELVVPAAPLHSTTAPGAEVAMHGIKRNSPVAMRRLCRRSGSRSHRRTE